MLTLSNWEKQPLQVFYKNTALKNFAIFTGKHLCEIFKNTCFEEYLHTAASERTLWSDIFVSGSHFKASWLGNIIRKYQPLSNQSFKQNVEHMLSIYLSPVLSCEPTFRMFIFNGYYTKTKRLQSLDSLLKDVNNILLCYLTRKKMAYKHDQNFSLTQKCHWKWYFALFLEQSTHLIVFLKKYLLTKADTYCPIKAVFLKILQNSLENTCATVFFNNVAACNFIKKRLGYRHFPVNFEEFLRILVLC